VNLVLLEAADFVTGTRARITGRRRDHVVSVLRARVGDTVVAGREGGAVGRGRIVAVDAEAVVLDCVLDRPPPAPLPVVLVLALPRPPVLRRVLLGATALGVKRIFLVGARAVEKSFWQSHALAPDALRAQLVLGLEQARDTVLPEVALRRRFRPFAEDELPALARDADAFVAHPAPDAALPTRAFRDALLAVGPEGGWSDHELERLGAAGLRPISLGDRPLRVETAVPPALRPAGAPPVRDADRRRWRSGRSDRG